MFANRMRFLAKRRPVGLHEAAAEESSVRHLQELYTVAVGLALTVGVERLISADKTDNLNIGSLLIFAGFMATLVPFYHGAQRHMDHSYVFADRAGSRRGVLLVDFMALFVEAGLLVAMGATVDQPMRFLAVFLILLAIDVVWLESFIRIARRSNRPSAAKLGKHERGWVVANVPTLMLGLILWGIQAALQPTLLSLSIAVALLALLRTAFDYWWNWEVYFPVDT